MKRPGLALRRAIGAVAALLIAHPATAQDVTPAPQPRYALEAERIVARMTVQQKVGQLLLVSFPGDEAAPDSDIADLVRTFHIGGVQMKASLQNFSNADDTPAIVQAARTARDLQALAFLDVYDEAAPTATARDRDENVAATVMREPTAAPPVAVPLFIGLAQDSEVSHSLELSEITADATQPPSPMALGATWKPANALEVGRTLGNELARAGINLYFGPGLDVLDAPRPGTPGDPGVHVFGGDPYWVGRFGAAYYSGLREGSADRVALVARNFPGLGASDRNVLDEIPTVQKSLDQLRQNELLPYFAVTQRAAITDTIVDGLQTTHIRFRGFQGNIRSSTRPISIDPQAYQALFALPELAAWRDGGGVTFSEQLGARSIRRFYDANETTFNARRIAQEAFVAGNDVLVLGTFGLGKTWQEQVAAIKEVAGFFANKYVDDPAFAARVDQTVRRIIALKLRIYEGSFAPDRVFGDRSPKALPADAAAKIAADVARDAVTLLSPGLRDLPSAIPAPPGRGDSIVFLTDDRPIQECARCTPYAAIDKQALRSIALTLYGPAVTGQVDPNQTYAFALSDLLSQGEAPAATLKATEAATETVPTAQRMRSAIATADWIVISILDMNASVASSEAFRRFLADQADTFRNKRVILFAFGAPYHLDATEVSKITAYFGVYGRSTAALTAAVRVLFGEYVPTGTSPVSVDATRYILSQRLAPDPEQLIPLLSTAIVSGEITAVEPIVLKIGDKLDLTAGPIFDLNGNAVPDGTEVFFVLNYPNEGVEQPRIPATTRSGIARITLPIERQGTLNITVESDQAKRSDTIRVNAAIESVSVERIQPTAMPTLRPEPTATEATVPTATPEPAPSQTQPVTRVSAVGFALTLLILAMGAIATAAAAGVRSSRPNTRLRSGIIVWICGWMGYVAFALDAPGTTRMASAYGWLGGSMIAGVCALLAFGVIVFVKETGNRD